MIFAGGHSGRRQANRYLQQDTHPEGQPIFEYLNFAPVYLKIAKSDDFSTGRRDNVRLQIPPGGG